MRPSAHRIAIYGPPYRRSLADSRDSLVESAAFSGRRKMRQRNNTDRAGRDPKALECELPHIGADRGHLLYDGRRAIGDGGRQLYHRPLGRFLPRLGPARFSRRGLFLISHFRIGFRSRWPIQRLPSLAKVHRPERGCSGSADGASSPARAATSTELLTAWRPRRCAITLSVFSLGEVVSPTIGVLRRERDIRVSADLG
jgi:hypothetical protein